MNTLQTNRTYILRLKIYLPEYNDKCYIYFNLYQINDYKGMCSNYEKEIWIVMVNDSTNINNINTHSNLKIFNKINGGHLCWDWWFLIFSESTLIVLLWVEWLLFLFSFTSIFFFIIIAMHYNSSVRPRYLWWRVQEYMSLFKWSRM